jgi:predicted nucleic acid-binding protein
MRIGIDTNLILRAIQPGHPHYLAASTALAVRASDELCVVPQILYEFWAVAARPVLANGLGLSALEAEQELRTLQRIFIVLDEPRDLLRHWIDTVARLRCIGKPSHDARLALAFQLNGVSELLTFNGSDFARFEGLTVHEPTT